MTIFTKAYQVIYNAESDNLIENPSNIIIDCLLLKIQYSALAQIRGKDVVDNNNRAICVMVGTLFVEGQRVRLLKHQLKEQQHQQKQQQNR